MQEFPHFYAASAQGAVNDDIMLKSPRLPPLRTAAPAEFGGPGDRWSPETMLVGAVANCFILTFRAVARAAKLSWVSLNCDVEGTLDRVERVTQFTSFTVRARLHVPPGTDEEQARRLLEKAEHACLITNSLKAPTQLEVALEVVPETEPAASWHQTD